VLVNIFAGITDLGEFATLLAAAIQASPGLRVPVVARLVGRNAAQAQRILGEAQPGMFVTEDLQQALARIDAIVAAAS
jgi:succinyl-CoA synthetase beta subunit